MLLGLRKSMLWLHYSFPTGYDNPFPTQRSQTFYQSIHEQSMQSGVSILYKARNKDQQDRWETGTQAYFLSGFHLEISTRDYTCHVSTTERIRGTYPPFPYSNVSDSNNCYPSLSQRDSSGLQQTCTVQEQLQSRGRVEAFRRSWANIQRTNFFKSPFRSRFVTYQIAIFESNFVNTSVTHLLPII